MNSFYLHGVYKLFRKLAILLPLLLLSILALVTSPSQAQSNTHTVCATGCDFDLLQVAIDGAGPGDTLLLMDPVHTEQNIQISKDLTIRGSGTAQTILQANGSASLATDRVIYISPGRDVVLEKMTIRNGNSTQGAGIYVTPNSSLIGRDLLITGNEASESGAGIYNLGALQLQGTSISNNIVFGETDSINGVGLYSEGESQIRLINVNIDGNEATAMVDMQVIFGVGAYIKNPAVLHDCSISNNVVASVPEGSSAYGIGLALTEYSSITTCQIDGNEKTLSSTNVIGGGIFTTGDTTIFRSTISDNLADVGGGIYYRGGTHFIRQSEMFLNIAADGGAVGLSTQAEVSIEETTLVDNFAFTGGAIVQSGGNLFVYDSNISTNVAFIDGGGIAVLASSFTSLNNTTIASNQADEDGGGIYSEANSQLVLANTTIVLNEADSDANGSGHGGGVYRTGNEGSLKVLNSLIATNKDLSPVPFIIKAADCYGEIDSGDHNLIGTLGINLINPGQLPCTINPANNLIGADPMLGILGSYGGWTSTVPLLDGSAAINAGDLNGCTDGSGRPLAQDQRHFQRIDRCDIGAYEYNGIQQFEQFIPLVNTPPNN